MTPISYYIERSRASVRRGEPRRSLTPNRNPPNATKKQNRIAFLLLRTVMLFNTLGRFISGAIQMLVAKTDGAFAEREAPHPVYNVSMV